MAGTRRRKNREGKYYPYYEGWYINYEGKQVYFKGTSNQKETEAMAKSIEEEHRKIRLGYAPIPESFKDRSFNNTVEDYISWGKMHGGKRDNPWSVGHNRMVVSYLKFWQDELNLHNLSDLAECLPKVEKSLQKLKEKGRSGKTLTSYASALIAFCNWCINNDYLKKNPLAKLRSFNSDPKFQRRAMTLEEINKLLDVCAPSRRLLYEMALNTGLRKGELGHLRVKDLDFEVGGIQLRKEWTKNRKTGFQPVPTWLLEKLGRDIQGKSDDDLLLEVPSHTAREMDKDLKLAGIPKTTSKGKVDFHALRVAYITLLIRVGKADPKEAQELARHGTLHLTMDTYARAYSERLKEVSETVGDSMKNGVSPITLPEPKDTEMTYDKGTTRVCKEEDPEEQKHKQMRILDRDQKLWRRRESNPRPKALTEQATTCLVFA